MFDESIAHLREAVDDASRLTSDYFKKIVHFSKATQLSEPERCNGLLRLEIDHPQEGMPKTVILKQFDANSGSETEIKRLSRFAHDWAAHEFLTQIGSDHAPLLYAGSFAHKFILLEDLGISHVSLVGPLTRSPSSANVQEAQLALLAYVRRLGKMHADTFGKSKHFTSILTRIYPHALRFNFLLMGDASNILTQFKELIGDASKELAREIHDIFEFSTSHADFHVLLHGDICPDNVYFQDNEIKLIDFEFGDFGNALLDGVYLRMNMPTCWCSKAIPQTLLTQMEYAYREELKKGVVGALDDAAYNKQLTYACAYWIIRAISTLDVEHEVMCQTGPLELDSQWDPKDNGLRPRILSRLNAFVACSENTGHLPKFCEASKRLLAHLKKFWPESRFIDVYPVFKE